MSKQAITPTKLGSELNRIERQFEQEKAKRQGIEAQIAKLQQALTASWDELMRLQGEYRLVKSLLDGGQVETALDTEPVDLLDGEETEAPQLPDSD
jgi:chromosome segregation ATPase